MKEVKESGLELSKDIAGESEKEFRMPATVTNELIAMWKATHRKVISVSLDDDGEVFTGFFRRPTMETISAVNTLAKRDEMKASITLFDNCWLGGDPEIKEDTALKMASMAKLQTLLEVKVQEVKNW